MDCGVYFIYVCMIVHLQVVWALLLPFGLDPFGILHAYQGCALYICSNLFYKCINQLGHDEKKVTEFVAPWKWMSSIRPNELMCGEHHLQKRNPEALAVKIIALNNNSSRPTQQIGATLCHCISTFTNEYCIFRCGCVPISHFSHFHKFHYCLCENSAKFLYQFCCCDCDCLVSPKTHTTASLLTIQTQRIHYNRMEHDLIHFINIFTVGSEFVSQTKFCMSSFLLCLDFLDLLVALFASWIVHEVDIYILLHSLILLRYKVIPSQLCQETRKYCMTTVKSVLVMNGTHSQNVYLPETAEHIRIYLSKYLWLLHRRYRLPKANEMLLLLFFSKIERAQGTHTAGVNRLSGNFRDFSKDKI